MEAGYILVDLLGQEVDLRAVAAGGRVEQLHQGQHLSASVHGHGEAGNAAREGEKTNELYTYVGADKEL